MFLREVVEQLRELNSQLAVLRSKVDRAELLYLLSARGSSSPDLGKLLGGILGPGASPESAGKSA
jgi:hypothetical protein